MIVVSDTSPLNYLILIGHVDILPILFQRVVSPPAVIMELLHPRTPQLVRVWADSPPPWMEVLSPSVSDPTLKLGPGEAAAICLARELHADVLLVDERKATQAALQLGLPATGVLGALDLAAEQQLLNLAEAVTKLRETTFRIPEEIVSALLQRDTLRRAT